MDAIVLNLMLLLGLLVFLIILRQIRANRKKTGSSYDEIYKEVLTSDEYKVKGQFED